MKMLALLLSLFASPAAAAGQIGSGPARIEGGMVGTAKIASGSIDTPKLAADSVTSTAILNLTIAAADIASGAIDTDKIASGAIDSPKLKSGAILAHAINAGAVETAKIGSGAVDTTKLLTDAVVAGAILAGAVETAKLAADSVIASKVLAGAIETAKLATDSVIAAKILAGAVETSKLASGSVDTTKLAKDAVANNNILAGSVDTTKLASGAVDTTKLLTDAVASGAILSDAAGLAKVSGGIVSVTGGVVVSTSNIYAAAQNGFFARYDTTNDYAASLRTTASGRSLLVLGGNTENQIWLGQTATGGNLAIYGNNTTAPYGANPASNGKVVMTISSGGIVNLNLPLVGPTVFGGTKHVTLGVGDRTSGAIGSQSSIGFGYYGADTDHFPCAFGYVVTSGIGNTNGDLLMGCRNVTTNTPPTEYFRMDAAGNSGFGVSATRSSFSATGMLAFTPGGGVTTQVTIQGSSLTVGGASLLLGNTTVSSATLTVDGTSAGLRVTSATTVGTLVSAWLSSSTSLNFAAIDPAVAAYEDLTMTVTGASNGDVCALGIPNALAATAGLSFTCFVSADNTVTVRAVCNGVETAGVQAACANPAAANVRTTVWKQTP